MNWSEYTTDIKHLIPRNWVDVSSSNDLCPSYLSNQSEIKGYIVFMDCPIERERECMGHRFMVMNFSGSYDVLFESDDFLEILAWIDDHPKSPYQISQTIKEIGLYGDWVIC